jgi:hypothetical protein
LLEALPSLANKVHNKYKSRPWWAAFYKDYLREPANKPLVKNLNFIFDIFSLDFSSKPRIAVGVAAH